MADATPAQWTEWIQQDPEIRRLMESGAMRCAAIWEMSKQLGYHLDTGDAPDSVSGINSNAFVQPEANLESRGANHLVWPVPCTRLEALYAQLSRAHPDSVGDSTMWPPKEEAVLRCAQRLATWVVPANHTRCVATACAPL